MGKSVPHLPIRPIWGPALGIGKIAYAVYLIYLCIPFDIVFRHAYSCRWHFPDRKTTCTRVQNFLSCRHDSSWHCMDAYRQVFIFLSVLRLKLHTLVAREYLASGVSLLVGLDIFDYSAQMVLVS